MEIFDIENIPAIGFGMGDVTMKEFLKGHNLLPNYTPATQVYVCTISPDEIPSAFDVADSLRKSGINTEVNLTHKKVGEQVKLADKKDAPFVVFVGEQEKQEGKYMVKNMTTGEEKQLAEADIPDFIRQESGENTQEDENK